MKRNLYLHPIDLEEAQSIFLHQVKNNYTRKTTLLPTTACLGCVTSRAVYAQLSSPMFHASAMDGIAVVAKETTGASEGSPKILHGNYQQIDTGDPILPPYNAVIMAEDIISDIDGEITIISPAAPWQHIRPIGEDIVQGEMVLPSYHVIRPMDIGVLLAAGILEVEVFQAPTVGIIPTGTEMISLTDYYLQAELGKQHDQGYIIESNAGMFAGLVTEAGGVAHCYPPTPDQYDTLKNIIQDACKHHDIILVNAGSSAGREDYTVSILRELGEVFVHGVAIKPGKPIILAMVGQTPVIGLPGYPVSAYIDFETFVKPILALYTGRQLNTIETVNARLSSRIVSSLKHQEYVRVQVGLVHDQYIATPLPRGAGAAMSLVRADGFCVIPKSYEGIEAGELTEIQLLKPLATIQNRIVSIGSHDLLMDLLGDQLKVKQYGLTSMHVGSMGGILALKRGEAHIAPIHLLDERSGLYNVDYVRRYLKEPMTLIRGVGRIQGLMVKKGNPKKIQSLTDLTHVHYVNRQRGSGTRILLDVKLKELGIQPSDINGYDYEVTTHMAVAASVSEGNIDTGLGVYSAAKAFDLDFIEIGVELYDFVVPTKYLELDMIQVFIDVLKSHSFKHKLMNLGGYTTDQIGELSAV